ncbi:MAG: IS256 family transposase, partial [Actinomycetes bacterium]
LRLITAVCVEQHDEWIAAERRYLSEQSMAQLASTTTEISPEAGSPTLMA